MKIWRFFSTMTILGLVSKSRLENRRPIRAAERLVGTLKLSHINLSFHVQSLELLSALRSFANAHHVSGSWNCLTRRACSKFWGGGMLWKSLGASSWSATRAL